MVGSVNSRASSPAIAIRHPAYRPQQPDLMVSHLHRHAPTDPAGGSAIVSRLDFYAAIQMDRALAVQCQ